MIHSHNHIEFFIIFSKKIVSAGKGPETIILLFFSCFIAGDIILSSSDFSQMIHNGVHTSQSNLWFFFQIFNVKIIYSFNAVNNFFLVIFEKIFFNGK